MKAKRAFERIHASCGCFSIFSAKRGKLMERSNPMDESHTSGEKLQEDKKRKQQSEERAYIQQSLRVTQEWRVFNPLQKTVDDFKKQARKVCQHKRMAEQIQDKKRAVEWPEGARVNIEDISPGGTSIVTFDSQCNFRHGNHKCQSVFKVTDQVWRGDTSAENLNEIIAVVKRGRKLCHLCIDHGRVHANAHKWRTSVNQVTPLQLDMTKKRLRSLSTVQRPWVLRWSYLAGSCSSLTQEAYLHSWVHDRVQRFSAQNPSEIGWHHQWCEKQCNQSRWYWQMSMALLPFPILVEQSFRVHSLLYFLKSSYLSDIFAFAKLQGSFQGSS